MVTQTIPLNGINLCSEITLLVINAFFTILKADTKQSQTQNI